ncbi:hypothetical protein Cni_G06979 [Canna indica]|uniref:U1-type domain-containing protein n=1 Tax=Canna indica TaxID=4628 RepID=A0AAQ3JXQ6_9LILI|nr:hypothetical protein Cni_G06979 [Canna indica]
MEFRHRAGDERPSSVPSPNPSPVSFSDLGYFREQALRAGFLGIAGGAAIPQLVAPASLIEPVERAMLKEMIREEMLKEAAERRILEEEVRRELEMEGLLSMRRFPQEQKMLVLPVSDSRSMREHAHLLRTARPQVVLDEATAVGTETKTINVKGSPLSVLNLEQRSTNSSPRAEVQPSNDKVSGNKRKGTSTVGKSKKAQDWSCAICQVNATSESSLNIHLQGKKHAKAAALASKKARICPNSKSNLRPEVAAASKVGGEPNNMRRTVKIQVDGKLHEVLRNGDLFWCELCDVHCNTTIMIVTHLNGKKHIANLKESEKASSPARATSSQTRGKEILKDLAAFNEALVDTKDESTVEKDDEEVFNSTKTEDGGTKSN